MTEQKKPPANRGQGRKPNKIKTKRITLFLAVKQADDLLATGNASLTARRILAANGFPEEPITI